MDLNKFFDDSVPFVGEKLKMLENIVSELYKGNPDNMNQARVTLEKLETETNFWLRTDKILESSKHRETLFFSLSALQKGVETKWKLLNGKQKLSIKSYVETYMNKLIETRFKENRIYLSKINSILAVIIKNELFGSWPTALSDLAQSCYTSQALCENNLMILKELSTEIFDFWKNSISSADIIKLKNKFASEFKSVFDVCIFIGRSYIEDPSKIKNSLMLTCLETINSFLGWMPIYYIFLTDLIENFLLKLLVQKNFTLHTLKSFEIIFGFQFEKERSNLSEEDFKTCLEKLVRGYCLFIENLSSIYNCNTNFEVERQVISNNDSIKTLNQFQMFTQNLSLVFLNFFQKNISLIEKFSFNHRNSPFILDSIKMGMSYMSNLSMIEDKTVFKTCVDFWLFLTTYYRNIKKGSSHSKNKPNQVLQLNNQDQAKLKSFQQ